MGIYNMKSEITVGVNVELNVSEETANAALKLVEMYCNSNGCSVRHEAIADGAVKLSFISKFSIKQFLNSYTKELIDQPIVDVYEDYCSFCSCNDYKVETRKAFTVAVNKIKGYKSHPAKKYGATVRVFKPCNDKCNDF